MQDILDEALRRASAVTGDGTVASYIPELARANPAHCGLAIVDVGGRSWRAGDADQPFTLQSVSKVFALACVQSAGVDPFQRMFVEPSGDAFHSIVRLEEEQGRPRNPFINAGAIVVSGLLPGHTPDDKTQALIHFLGRCGGATGLAIDDAVYQSERRTGYRNRALAYYMKHYGVVDDPEASVDTYFRQCAVRVTTADLARLALFLAGDGTDPLTGETLLTPALNRSLLAIMSTCGLYDEVGRFALDVGLPAKSGVSGAILAVVPGRMSIAAWGPALGPRGNSVAAFTALKFLAGELGLTLFAPPAATPESVR